MRYQMCGPCGMGARRISRPTSRRAVPARTSGRATTVKRAKPRYPNIRKHFCPSGCDGTEADFDREIASVIATLRSWDIPVHQETGEGDHGPYIMWKVGSSRIADEVRYVRGPHAPTWNGMIDYGDVNAMFDPRSGYTGYGQEDGEMVYEQKEAASTLVKYISVVVQTQEEAQAMLGRLEEIEAAGELGIKSAKIYAGDDGYWIEALIWTEAGAAEEFAQEGDVITIDDPPGQIMLATADDVKELPKWVVPVGIGAGVAALGLIGYVAYRSLK